MFYNGFWLYCCREWTKAQPFCRSTVYYGSPNESRSGDHAYIYTTKTDIRRYTRSSGVPIFFPDSHFFPSVREITSQDKTPLKLYAFDAAPPPKSFHFYIYFFSDDFKPSTRLYGVLMFCVSARMCILHWPVCLRVIRSGLSCVFMYFFPEKREMPHSEIEPIKRSCGWKKWKKSSFLSVTSLLVGYT